MKQLTEQQEIEKDIKQCLNIVLRGKGTTKKKSVCEFVNCKELHLDKFLESSSNRRFRKTIKDKPTKRKRNMKDDYYHDTDSFLKDDKKTQEMLDMMNNDDNKKTINNDIGKEEDELLKKINSKTPYTYEESVEDAMKFFDIDTPYLNEKIFFDDTDKKRKKKYIHKDIVRHPKDNRIDFKDLNEYKQWLNTKKEKPLLQLVKEGIVIMIGNEIYISTIKK